ncbi:MAG: M3 family metallopeptidase [Pseudomonadota bacterium]
MSSSVEISNGQPINPAIFNWDTQLGLPRFNAIAPSDFADAFDHALQEDRIEINAIADNPQPPSFENTIEALERSGEALNRVASIFWNLIGAHSNEDLRSLERTIAPKMSQHSSETGANEHLFQRIDTLWQTRDTLGLTVEQTRVLERKWKGMVKSGAALPKDQQDELATINARLASLGAQFSQNILADEANWSLHITDETNLDGLPAFLRDAMGEAARERGFDTGYCVTLSRSIIEPFLTHSTKRNLRAQAFEAWTSRGRHEGDHDNRPLVKEILALRQRKATLLGHESFAHFKLEDQMAKTPDAVRELLETVWDKARTHALEEEAQLTSLSASLGENEPIKPSDWRYYAEQVRQANYDFNDAELKPYFALDAMIEAAFDVATRLFGVRFEEQEDTTAYHEDVRVFRVLNAAGEPKAIFLADYFARPSKRSGAWMSGFQSQHKLSDASNNPTAKDGQLPIIVNVMNFAKAAKDKPSLLSLDDARTLFHEFGHALHGMMSNVTYPSVSGTSVARDFVELPSQLFEHWLMVPDILKKHARHVETGETIPDAMLEKLKAAEHFNAGFQAIEFTASALVDLAFHTPQADGSHEFHDVMAFEKSVLDTLQMPASIAMRHSTPHFAHVFSGDGYSAGYYSYMWSEVLDADAFTAFEETGDPFDPEMSKKLLEHIYSAGGSVDPHETYTAFRGKMPTPDAMLEKRGLI